jgi:hypothetical protein
MRKLLTALVALAAAAVIVAVPAGAITNGVPDGNGHPFVGELLFYVPDEVDSRFTDPGAWFTCSGTLVSPTVVLTAGHCTFGVGKDGVATTPTGGRGGDDVWVNFDESPDFSILPPSSTFAPGGNQQRYDAWSAALNGDPAWHRGTADPHPDFDPAAFFLHDLGVIVLKNPVSTSNYGQVAPLGALDAFLKNGKNTQLFTPVGYGLNRSGPPSSGKDAGGDTRFTGTVKIDSLKGTFGIPEGTTVKFSNNNGKPHQGGTCFGDSGGPYFAQGTREIVAVTSFGTNDNCAGTGGAYRIDQQDDLDFLATFGVTPPSS